MATLPAASVVIDDTAGAFAGGTGYCVVMGCAQSGAVATPLVFASAKSLIDTHGYSPAVDYAALHIQTTKKPVIFVRLTTATVGVVGRQNSSGVTGTSVISIAAGAAGYLEETDSTITVVNGGTIGVTGITFNYSADGGRTEKLIRLGTASSYTVPYLGIVISFAAGTLIAGDVYSFTTTAPMWDSAGLAAARTALAQQQKLSRSWLIAGDIANSTVAGYVTTAVNAYETANDRFCYARVNVRDRLPLAVMAKETVRMSGTPTLTFAEVGATGDTITRSAGSFVADGFATGMAVTVSGSVSNNFTDAKITGVSALVLTLDTQDLVAEGPVSNCTVLGSVGVTFAEVGGTGDTITRSGGSWLDDGFAAGDIVTVSGSAGNNVTTDAITTVTATVMTLNTTDLAAEFVGARTITVTKGETMATWVGLMASAFASVDDQKRIDLGLGRLRVLSPVTSWEFRRPVAWAASVREYSHDVHIPCWRKADGPLLGWSMVDTDGTIVEYDERTDGGALADRFTAARSYGNGPNGAFVALSMTRATEGSLLSRTHNMAVANVACTVVHAATENVIGAVLQLNDDGTATAASLSVIEEAINTDLEIALLQAGIEGPRASKAVWRASTTDILNTVGATLTGVLDLHLNGTVEQIATTVKVS